MSWKGDLIKAGIYSDGNNVDIFRGNLSVSGGMLEYNPSGGKDYYVDGNDGQSGRTGFGWDNSLDSLVEAIELSNTWIGATARGWAVRNRIFGKGDKLTENLTTFPTKCDVIGVGSCDAFVGAGILGNHAPTGEYFGTRWINCNFFPAASGDIMTITSSGSGLQFIGCRFVGVWGAFTAPSAIDITAHPMAKIIGCEFEGAFSGDVIDVGAGDASGMKIVGNNIIGGADNGIVVTGVATVVGATSRGLIKDNFIQVADKVIDARAVSVYNIMGNRGISAEAAAGDAYVIDPTFAVDNHITFGDDSHNIPSIAD